MTRSRLALIVFLILAPIHAQTTPNDDRFNAAAAYSAGTNGDALLVYIDGELVFEEYQNGYDGTTPHALFSGTKSFSCAIALIAQRDGLLTLDETLADTLTEWQGDAQKSQVTLRQLLSLTSGVRGDETVLRRARVDTYALAVEAPSEAAPGERFRYGNTQYGIFGAFMMRKFAAAGLEVDPATYLAAQVTDALDMPSLSWTRDSAGNPLLASGAQATARDWAQFGLLILAGGMWEGEQLLPAETLPECFMGSAANPNYGLTFWLGYETQDLATIVRQTLMSPEPATSAPTETPAFWIAAGANNQRLYIIPAHNMVVVRFGRRDRRFRDGALMTELLAGVE
ncbi:MAG: serine hydrolase [Armatimonadetes bacterium]|nr:serine hydrolase [Anaerolineae bacterium]